MKTTIYYFSGTGNSLKMAGDLAKKLGDSELVPIAKEIHNKAVSPKTEAVGFVFPVYFWGLPVIVRQFIEKIDLKNSDYLFGIITLGAMSGGALTQLKSLLKTKNKILDAGFLIKLPDSYIPIFEVPSVEEQKKLSDQAEIKLQEISEVISKKKNKIEKENIILRNTAKIVNSIWARNAYKADKKFTVDDTCTSCGICEKVCPVNNVKLEEGRPRWHHNCQECFACMNFCPARAIQFGNKTKKRGRYYHPDIKAKDIMEQQP